MQFHKDISVDLQLKVYHAKGAINTKKVFKRTEKNGKIEIRNSTLSKKYCVNMEKNFRKLMVKNNKKPFENKIYSKKDYDDTFILLKASMLLLGIRLTRSDTPFMRIFWISFYWFEFANIIGMGILITMFIAKADFDNIFEIFKMTPCVGYLFLGMSKSYKLVYYRPIFENIVNDLRDMWPEGVVLNEEDVILQKALRQLKLVARGYTFLNVAFAIIAFIPPYVEMLKEALGQEFKRVLPFFYWLPFDPFKNEYYLLMAIIQGWQGWVTMWMILCGDLLLYVLSGHVTAQFDLLSERIRRFIPVPVDQQLVTSYPLAKYAKGFENKDDLSYSEREKAEVNELKQIIIRHNALIRFTEDLDNLYGFSLLIHLLIASIIICFTGFCGVFIEKWNENVFKSFFIVNTGQTGLICWYGQKIMESSQGVTDALYDSGWYNSSKKIMLSILIMMQRSQKECRITTYGFSVISLMTFTTIGKTAWSYFTLMCNMYKG